jgi:hypothetical protein
MTDNSAPKMTYDDMLAEAQKIHPDMKLRVIGENNDEWEMFMPTHQVQPNTLPDRFKGTLAWDFFTTPNSSFGNELESYRRRKKLFGLPLVGVAEHINIHDQEQKWARPVSEKMHQEAGTILDWDSEISNEEFIAYTTVQRKVAQVINDEWKDRWDAFDLKWGR